MDIKKTATELSLGDLDVKKSTNLEELDGNGARYVVFNGEKGEEYNLQISKWQKEIIDLYIEYGGNMAAVKRKYVEKWKVFPSQDKIKKVLDYKVVKEYIASRVKDLGYDAGMSKERWIREAMEFRDGKRVGSEQSGFFHKLIGMANGYLSDQRKEVQFNQQINIVQADGSE